MSDNTNATEIKKLRDEVQLLRDELAIMKRKYEDIIYNLDTDNFSSRFVREQGDMRTAIEVNAKGIKSKVSNEEFSSQMEQTAEAIKTKVSQKDAEELRTSILEQTAENIKVAVESLDVDVDLSDYATTEWTSNQIVSTVNKTFVTNLVDDKYETKDNASTQYNTLNSSISQNAGSIEMVVAKNLSAKFQKSRKPTNTNTDNVEKGMLCEYDGDLYYYNGITKTWEIYPYSNRVSSQFLQTADGFELVGDVKIRGELIGSSYDGDTNLSCTVMNGEGLDVYDKNGNQKIALGTYKSRYKKTTTGPWVGDSILYPYFILGAGTKKYDDDDVIENVPEDAGCICKLQNGIWIGDSSLVNANRGGCYPGGVSSKSGITDGMGGYYHCGVDCNGIFIDFTDGTIYKYVGGFPEPI